MSGWIPTEDNLTLRNKNYTQGDNFIKKFTTALFDLDGTITDPAEGIINSYHFALNKLGLSEPDTSIISSYIGASLHLYFAEKHNLTDKNLEDGIKYYREYFSVKGIYENKLYEGFDILIKTLFESGINIYLVTSKPTVYAKEILRHFKLEQYFKGVYGSELTIQNTSKVDLIAEVIKKEKLDIDNVIMIGDRNLDVFGAKANNIRSAAVTFGYGSIKELQDSEPDYIIDTVEGLYELFK